MIKEFVPYEQSLTLKELGFNEPCLAHFTKNSKNDTPYVIIWEDYSKSQDLNKMSGYGECLAPLKQQAFRWFREKHNLFSFITTIDVYNQASDSYSFKFCFWLKDVENITMPVCETYEEAEEACINKLIEIIESK